MNPPGAMQRRRYAERIPGAVSEILRLIDDHDMLGRYAGKWRSHPNRHSIGLQYQHSLSAQSGIGFADTADIGANTFSYNLQRRPLPGLGEVPVDRQFRLRIKAHALNLSGTEKRRKIFSMILSTLFPKGRPMRPVRYFSG